MTFLHTLAKYLIRLGNRARSQRHWRKARRAYRGALRLTPARADIWVQYGHATKEDGDTAGALRAYEEACRLRPDDADTALQMGHALKMLGRFEEAALQYARAAGLSPSLLEARREVLALGRAELLPRRISLPVGMPIKLDYVNIGTTSICNASCVHCPTGKPETGHVPRQPMPMPLFRKIMDGIAEMELPIADQIAFGLFGDALVDPLVVQRTAYARDLFPDVQISINTNGAAFNRKKHEALRDFSPVIALHCESLVPETFDYLMQPLRHSRVFPKYREILDCFPKMVNVSVPVSQRNRAELPALQQWFLENGALSVTFDPLSSRCAEDRTLFNSLALKPQPIRCGPHVLDSLIVDADGKVLICCQDFQRIEGIGDFASQSFVEVMLGLERQRIRTTFANRGHAEMATCSRCYGDIRNGKYWLEAVSHRQAS